MFVGGYGTTESLFQQGMGSQYHEWGVYKRVYLHLRTPRGECPVSLAYLIPPPIARTKISSCEGMSGEKCQFEAGAEIGLIQDENEVTWKASVRLLYDARKGTVSLGQRTIPYTPKCVYVVQVDEHWQACLVQDDGSFASLNLPPAARQELVNARARTPEREPEPDISR